MYLRKALKGVTIAFVFTVLAGVVWYLFRFMLARNLSLYEYGLFYALLAFFSFFGLFVDLGFSQTVPKFIIDYKENKNYTSVKKVLLMSILFQLVVSVFLFLLIFLFSDFLSMKYFHNDISQYVILFGIWFVTLPFSYLLGYVFTGFQKYALSSSLEFLRASLSLIFSFIFFQKGLGIYSPIYAYALVSIVLPFIYYFFIYKIVSFNEFNLKPDFKILYAMLSFGIFVSFSSVIWVIISQMDTLLLTFFLGIEAVGLYQSAVPLASIALYFIAAVTVVSYPLSAELYAKKKYVELRIGINLFYKYLLLILIPCLMILFAFSDSIIYVLFGSEFVEAQEALKILAIGAIFSSLTVFNNNLISAVGKPKIVAKNMLYVALINIVGCIILIPKYGINGAAFATALSFFVGAIISLIALNNIIKTKIPISDWLKTIFAGILMVMFVIFAKLSLQINNLLGFLIVSGAGFIFYLLICLGFRIIDIKEIKYFIKNIIK